MTGSRHPAAHHEMWSLFHLGRSDRRLIGSVVWPHDHTSRAARALADDGLGETWQVASWDDEAERYIEMVRDPSQGFNHLAGDVADELLGRVEGRTVLDIGCGEGSFARRLARRGAKVVAVEPTERLLAAAIDAERETPLGIDYRNDRAETLDAVESASVDLAVALLVMHHVADLESALRSARRVLRPDGKLVRVVPHPTTDHAGATWATTADGLRRTIGSYTDEGFWQSDSTGALRAIGWHHRTIATWCNCLVDTGFVVERVREPVGAEPRRVDAGGPWQHVPRFLALRARRGEDAGATQGLEAGSKGG